ncbi:galectin-2 [Coprinopsis sp. MPI-PUGE-AT-0042]|nr:galectin-2 [Coprinopsis sp. MPI-PUGE-AT-0042]
MLYHLPANGKVQLESAFKAESIAIIRSSKLAFNPSQGAAIFNFDSEDHDTVLHISIRPRDHVVVFNSRVRDGTWGPEERITFDARFKDVNPTITVYDHGDRFQILFDYTTVKYYNKRNEKDVAAIVYGVDETRGLAFSEMLTVDVYASFAELV